MNTIGINIWDDFNESEGSFIYVDESNLTLEEQKKILDYIFPLIKIYFPEKTEFSFYLYDTKKEYPDFDRSPRNLDATGWTDWCRWKITIKNITYEELESVMSENGLEKLKLYFENKEIYFYSES